MNAEPRPCACGRPGCMVIRKPGVSSGDFAKQRFASRSCSTWFRNVHSKAMSEARRKGGRASAIEAGRVVDDDDCGLITPVEWLSLAPARIRVQRQVQGVRL